MDLELHPLCTCFPEMTADEFEKLRESIQGMGLRLPIVLFEGMILDGRHRHRVCVEEGIEPFFEEYRGPGSPSDYVYDMNLRRRDLNTAQKIEAASALHAAYVKWAEARRAKGWQKRDLVAPVPLDADNVVPLSDRSGKSRDHLAKDIGTSPRTVQDALTVRKNDPAKWQEVLSGEKSIKAAAKEVRAKVDAITLGAWKAMSADERAEALKPSKVGSLNEQNNDSIGWAKYSWNPVTGCLHNCPYCYARDIAKRFYPQGFVPSIIPDRLAAPIKAKPRKPDGAERNIFTCSMADLFGKWVPEEWIEAVMSTVRQSPQWNFLMLTKFPLRMVDRKVPENVWLGTSIDTQSRVKAVEDAFAKVPAHTRWLSLEPLLEPLKFSRPELFHWVVIGGASPSSQTPAWTPPFEWQMDLYCQFAEAGARIYFKGNALHQDFPWSKPQPQRPDKAFARAR
jgi:protein gp37